jgi:hypothetical protein
LPHCAQQYTVVNTAVGAETVVTLAMFSVAPVGGIVGVVEGIVKSARVVHKAAVAVVVCEGVADKKITLGVINNVAVANAVSCPISKGTTNAAGATAIVMHRSAFDIVVVPFATRTTCTVTVTATGITACNVAVDANLTSVVGAVNIIAIAVADAVAGAVIEG